MSYKEDQAARLDGLFTGQCQPEEYQSLIDEGYLYRSYEGVAGFMGLSRLRRCEKRIYPSPSDN